MAGEEARGLSRKSEVAAAIRYTVSRWRALLRYINGRLPRSHPSERNTGIGRIPRKLYSSVCQT